MQQPNPRVSCVLLSCGSIRDAMRERALRGYATQTYEGLELIVYEGPKTQTIGEMRNVANGMAHGDIIAHLDEDDLSHPNRIAEQVALLTSSGADAVGYSDLLFWDTRLKLIDTRPFENMPATGDALVPAREAWLYSRPTRLNAPGTTLCYWRKTWERKPFPHLPEVGNPTSQGEDIVWQAGLKVVAISSVREFVHLHPEGTFAGVWDQSAEHDDTEPRMIASVHSGNTMAAGYSHMGHVEEFRRVPLWDSYCERVMKP